MPEPTRELKLPEQCSDCAHRERWTWDGEHWECPVPPSFEWEVLLQPCGEKSTHMSSGQLRDMAAEKLGRPVSKRQLGYLLTKRPELEPVRVAGHRAWTLDEADKAVSALSEIGL